MVYIINYKKFFFNLKIKTRKEIVKEVASDIQQQTNETSVSRLV